MRIGIDASKINIRNKTGTEKYCYDMISGLLKQAPREYEFILYSPDQLPQEILALHNNVEQRIINWKLPGWTLFGLSMALFLDKPEVFYSPGSILPLWSPPKSISVIHGLEFEAFPQAYSFFRFWHLATFTLLSAKRAYKVIVPSESTKDDLISEYCINEKKIVVVYSGIDITTRQTKIVEKRKKPYLFWIGRKEVRKNLDLVLEVFELIKPDFPELELVLAGTEGYGYKELKQKINKSPFSNSIIEIGYVSEDQKYSLISNAELMIFPSWYEGFGYPILEAFLCETPIIVSDSSSLPEIAGDGAMIISLDGENYLEKWRQGSLDVLSSQETKDYWIEKGKQRLAQFSLTSSIKYTYKVIIS